MWFKHFQNRRKKGWHSYFAAATMLFDAAFLMVFVFVFVIVTAATTMSKNIASLLYSIHYNIS